MERYFQLLSIALEAVFANKIRSVLTALGIIFGVAAVISMMAIGNGAQKEILDQIKLVGVNNIVILPVNKDETKQGQESEEGNGEEEGKTLRKKFSPGLSLKDAENISKTLPTVERVSPEITYPVLSIYKGRKTNVELTGVTNHYFKVFNLQLSEGALFSELQIQKGDPVCIIGPTVAKKLFPDEDPMGKRIKCGDVWLKVIGLLQGVKTTEKSKDLGVSDYNRKVLTPLKTLLLRYKDRSLVNQASFGGGEVLKMGRKTFFIGSEGKEVGEHQLNKIVVQVKETKDLGVTKEVIEKILNRRHQGVGDFEIKIPELLLKQEQRTKDIFNIVLGAIAGISLIVGGIGIMNIMLASVMERIREIGVRRAIGARKKDIIFQFLAEATFISITGGFIGVVLGVVLAKIITASTGILTIVSLGSILVSFGVAATVGIVFGWLPARKAAEQDPVESLRHD
jgi:putative ABC transport system permease protein